MFHFSLLLGVDGNISINDKGKHNKQTWIYLTLGFMIQNCYQNNNNTWQMKKAWSHKKKTTHFHFSLIKCFCIENVYIEHILCLVKDFNLFKGWGFLKRGKWISRQNKKIIYSEKRFYKYPLKRVKEIHQCYTCKLWITWWKMFQTQ